VNPFRWWKRWRAKVRAEKAEKAQAKRPPIPLREFVYLDEVSLRSLLSSQTGEMTESKSEQVLDALTAEANTKIAADAQVAKAELTSKFQTTNSSTLQTSRKATVQSWFRELHDLPGLKLIEPRAEVAAARDLETLTLNADPSVVARTSALSRGTLVEFRVGLTADPVFHMGTVVSEFSGMVEDYPEMIADPDAKATFKEFEPLNKILQRLLAGLIPVRGRALDYRVVVIAGVEYVVHREACAGLGLEERPLEIVGVTEHLAYWKDIRRVLFSSAEFTVLCRISKNGLHDTWTPVKLADLFSQMAPDLVEHLNAAGKLPFISGAHPATVITPAPTNATRLGEALRIYVALCLEELERTLTAEQMSAVEQEIDQIKHLAETASDQRSAFFVVEQALTATCGAMVSAARNLEFRDAARARAGVSLFPSLARNEPAPQSAPIVENLSELPRILDVEVVAIYW